MSTQIIIEKLNDLPPEKLTEVEDFVDFLRERTRREQVESASATASTASAHDKPRTVDLRELGISKEEAAELRFRLSTFAEDWERPEMDIYDDYDINKATLDAKS